MRGAAATTRLACNVIAANYNYQSKCINNLGINLFGNFLKLLFSLSCTCKGFPTFLHPHVKKQNPFCSESPPRLLVSFSLLTGQTSVKRTDSRRGITSAAPPPSIQVGVVVVMVGVGGRSMPNLILNTCSSTSADRRRAEPRRLATQLGCPDKTSTSSPPEGVCVCVCVAVLFDTPFLTREPSVL